MVVGFDLTSNSRRNEICYEFTLQPTFICPIPSDLPLFHWLPAFAIFLDDMFQDVVLWISPRLLFLFRCLAAHLASSCAATRKKKKNISRA